MSFKEIGCGLKVCGCVCASLQLVCVLVAYLVWIQAGDLFELVPMKDCFGKGEFDDTFGTSIDCEHFMTTANAERIFEGHKDPDGKIMQHIFLVLDTSITDTVFLQKDRMSEAEFQSIKADSDAEGKEFYGIDEYDGGMLMGAAFATLVAGLAIQLGSLATAVGSKELKEEGGKPWKLVVDALLWVLGNCVNGSLSGFECKPRAEGTGIISSNLNAIILGNAFGILFLLGVTGCVTACLVSRGQKSPALCCSGIGMAVVSLIGFMMVFLMTFPLDLPTVAEKTLIGSVMGDCVTDVYDDLPGVLPVVMGAAFGAGCIRTLTQMIGTVLGCIKTLTQMLQRLLERLLSCS
eukprot:TRINITY_DN39319_c0_g1_i1.p1 TRINITY_DN39319_c0_g1~~TRINITY_DN39319_c0_g1_i1.p1  ORF type:complete len:349 (+),score=54.51 TRINITY_DN39319_c0_g1_i1:80-1126(+)